MKDVLTVIQIISSLALILLIVMQAKGTGLSATFGGEGMFYRSKRGIEKLLFKATIAIAIILGVTSLLIMLFASKV